MCGNEGQHPYLDEKKKTSLRFLRAAISFIQDALKDGADLHNAAFIFAQPGTEFFIQAGHGDWEFFFSENQFGVINVRCVRCPPKEYIRAAKYSVGLLVNRLTCCIRSSNIYKILFWRNSVLALTDT